jgi:hypothetical protein
MDIDPNFQVVVATTKPHEYYLSTARPESVFLYAVLCYIRDIPFVASGLF